MSEHLGEGAERERESFFTRPISFCFFLKMTLFKIEIFFRGGDKEEGKTIYIRLFSPRSCFQPLSSSSLEAEEQTVTPLRLIESPAPCAAQRGRTRRR